MTPPVEARGGERGGRGARVRDVVGAWNQMCENYEEGRQRPKKEEEEREKQREIKGEV